MFTGARGILQGPALRCRKSRRPPRLTWFWRSLLHAWKEVRRVSKGMYVCTYMLRVSISFTIFLYFLFFKLQDAENRTRRKSTGYLGNNNVRSALFGGRFRMVHHQVNFRAGPRVFTRRSVPYYRRHPGARFGNLKYRYRDAFVVYVAGDVTHTFAERREERSVQEFRCCSAHMLTHIFLRRGHSYSVSTFMASAA